jgi:signal transduction histidine kinase
MRELSLHLVDIIQNSLDAGASIVEVEINEDSSDDILELIVRDNGSGMSEEVVKKVKDPFYTSRKTRKVGLGLSLLEAACIRCDGNLTVKSSVGSGTEVKAVLKYSHIDRAPLGRIEDTIITVLLHNTSDIVYTHRINNNSFVFDSREIKQIVGDDITKPEVLQWIREYISENIEQMGGGA